MTLLLYDEAVGRKLSKLFNNTIGAPPDEALFNSNKDGKVKLPLISYYRIDTKVDWSDYNDVEARRGWVTGRADDKSTVLRTMSISMNLTYQIDLWAADKTTADNLFHDMIFSLLVKPNITLKMEGTEADKVFSLRLIDENDSTSVVSFLDTNRIYRYTLTYEVNRARLMNQSVSPYTTVEIPIDNVVVEDKGSHGVDGGGSTSNPSDPYGVWSPGVKITTKDSYTDDQSVGNDPNISQNGQWIMIKPSKKLDNKYIHDYTDYNDETSKHEDDES